jgi:predicted metal-dependent hydrolase
MMATEAFKKEAQDGAKEIGVSPKEIHIRDLKRKWASCSSKGKRMEMSTYKILTWGKHD